MTIKQTSYAVQTHPHAEAAASAHPARQDYEIYFPRYAKTRPPVQRVEIDRASLFRRYVLGEGIQPTFGVYRILCLGDSPAEVPKYVIADLKSRGDERGLGCLPSQLRFLRGDKVRILESAFADGIALFKGMVDRDRVAILSKLLARYVRVLLRARGVALA
jgi:hypothetical protein